MADEHTTSPNTSAPQVVNVGKWFSAAPELPPDRLISTISAGDEFDGLGRLTVTPSNRLVIHGRNLASYTKAQIFDASGTSRVVPGKLEYRVVDGSSRTASESLTLPLLDYGDNEFHFSLFLDSTDPGVAPLRLTQKFAYARETEEEKEERQKKQGQADEKQKEAEAADFENKQTQNLQKIGNLSQKGSEILKDTAVEPTPAPTGITGDKLSHTWQGKKTEKTGSGAISTYTQASKKLEPKKEKTGPQLRQGFVGQEGKTETGSGAISSYTQAPFQSEPQKENTVNSAYFQSADEQVTGLTQDPNISQRPAPTDLKSSFRDESKPQSAQSTETNKTEPISDIKFPQASRAETLERPNEASQQERFTEPETKQPSFSEKSAPSSNAPQNVGKSPIVKPTAPESFTRPESVQKKVLADRVYQSGGNEGSVPKSVPPNGLSKPQSIAQAIRSSTISTANRSPGRLIGNGKMASEDALVDPDVVEAYQLIDAEVATRRGEYMVRTNGSAMAEMNAQAYKKVKGSIESHVWNRFAIDHSEKAQAFRSQITELDQVMSQQDEVAQESGIQTIISQKLQSVNQKLPPVGVVSKETTRFKNKKELAVENEFKGKFAELEKRNVSLDRKLRGGDLIKTAGGIAIGLSGEKKIEKKQTSALGSSLGAISENRGQTEKGEAPDVAKPQASVIPQKEQAVLEDEPIEEPEEQPFSQPQMRPETTHFDQNLPEEQQRDLAMQRGGQKLSSGQKRKISEARVKHAIEAINKALDGFLNSTAIIVWGSILLIPLGALVGDFLWLFKDQITGIFARPYLRTESMKKMGQEIIKQIKISGKVKGHILAMNIVTVSVPVVMLIIIMVVGCNAPAPGTFSFFGLMGYGDMCNTVSNVTNVGYNIGSSISTGVTSGGQCTALMSGPASAANLLGSCFGNNADRASAIAKAESGGDATRASGVDKCTVDGNVVSWGLFQINLTNHKIGGLDCPSAFDSQYTGSHKNCRVTNQALYQQCVTAAQNPALNIQAACLISSNGKNWNAWGANRICKF